MSRAQFPFRRTISIFQGETSFLFMFIYKPFHSLPGEADDRLLGLAPGGIPGVWHQVRPPWTERPPGAIHRAGHGHISGRSIHTEIHTYIDTYIHTYTHTYIHTYIHIQCLYPMCKLVLWQIRIYIVCHCGRSVYSMSDCDMS